MSTSRDRILQREARQAVADIIMTHFGADEVEDLLGDDPIDAVVDFEIESDLTGEYLDSEFEDMYFDDIVDDVLDFDDEDEDFLDDEEREMEADEGHIFSGSVSNMGRVQASYGARMGFLKGLGNLIGTAGKGFMQAGGRDILESSLPGADFLLDGGNLASSAGKALGKLASEEVQSFLPPLYVADDVTPSSSVAELDEVELDMEDEFGATCVAGMVARNSLNPRARKACVNAIWRGSKAVKSAPYGRASTFVEDPSSDAKIFPDGQIFDSVYGALSAVPCPACSCVSPGASFGASARDCAVCDGHGAILVPEKEVPDYVSSESYGWVPFLIPLVTAGASAGAQIVKDRKLSKGEDLERRKNEIFERLVAKSVSKDSFDDEDEIEIEESMGYNNFGSDCLMLRALTPKGK